MRADRPAHLGTWSAVLLALLAGHDLTHALDGGLHTRLSQLALVAIPQWVVLAAVMVVILRADRTRSALAALLLGTGTAVGFVAVHLLPFAPASFWDLHPSAISWVLLFVPPALGLWLAVRAWSEWRPRVAVA